MPKMAMINEISIRPCGISPVHWKYERKWWAWRKPRHIEINKEFSIVADNSNRIPTLSFCFVRLDDPVDFVEVDDLWNLMGACDQTVRHKLAFDFSVLSAHFTFVVQD